ncbi:MgtC/SapB family protein [Amycolatopsis jiangsuensis]|uniref:Putative Mg2+ transporter-C (MgtC) family protein n=1 Tax=Amycolatopsis jiangsuensis TaxID=1181879 RepID=A0A840J7L9_9PSEU|nr:MgtC/SapB family protein [Amycolatopsis jiangsuensis]MBB4689444.1 putative Mg2+ transporter-C (MgtC) family protein [Amycolatopsis jiangsuensis]
MHALWSTSDQWSLLLPVLVALVLSTVIGLEREAGNKQAGLRTHTLVGVGSAVFMLVSKYGFADLLGLDHVALDPSRIAAQIVSGIGFVGGGLIFVRRDAVRGLTTAATVWLAAAVGVACGAGLPVLGVATTAGLVVITRGFPLLSRFVARHRRQPPILRLSYADGHGVLRAVLTACTDRGWAVHRVAVDRETVSEEGQRIAVVTLLLQGRGDLADLTAELAELPGVRSTATGAEDPLED